MGTYLLLHKLQTWALLLCCCFTMSGTNPLHSSAQESTSEALPAVAKEIDTLMYQSRDLVRSHPDSAIGILKKAELLCRKHLLKKQLSKVLLAIGLPYINAGKYDLALESYIGAIAIPEGKNGYPGAYNNIANIYAYKGEYTKAIEFYTRTLLLVENDSAQLTVTGQLYNNLAASFAELNEWDKVLNYMKKAEVIKRMPQNRQSLHGFLLNKGTVLYKAGRLDSSLAVLQEALKLSIEKKDIEVEAWTLTTMGDAFREKNRPDTAISFYKRPLELIPLMAPYTSSSIYQSAGLTYLDLHDYVQAEQMLVPALQICQKNNLSKREAGVQQALASLYSKTKKWEKAYQHANAYSALRDSLLNEDRLHSINQLETKYKAAQKDKEISAKQLLITEQQMKLERKNSWILVISLGIILLAISILLIIRNNRQKQRLQAENMRVLKQRQEIHILKAMMQGEEKERIRIGRELHDGVSGLLSAVKINFSSIQHSYKIPSDAADYTNALELVDLANSELRKTAHNLMPEILLSDGLHKAIQNFCSLVSSGRNIEIEVNMYGEMPRLDINLELSLYRIIQELVHNIVKHSMATHALVQINWREEHFNVIVEDNGIGMQEQKSHSRPGIGMENIRARMKALEGYLEIDSSESGTTVCLEFEIDKIIPLVKI